MPICIIGTRWGLFLGQELRKFYRGPLAVCGRDPSRLKVVARRLNADRTFSTWQTAVRDPQITAFIVAVPPELHHYITANALASGKHVLVEKPMCTTLADCTNLINVAQSSGVALATGENIPFRPAIREAKRRISDVGEPRLFFGFSLHSAGGHDDRGIGVLLDVCVHQIRAVRTLFGEPDSVFASCAASHKFESSQLDNVTVVLRSRAGWKAVLIVSRQASTGTHPEFVLSGTQGALKISSDSAFLDFYPLERTWLTRAVASIRPTTLRQLLQTPETQRQRTRLPRADRMGYQAELESFLDQTKRGLPDVESALEARRDVEIAVAAYSSIATNSVVSCSPPPSIANTPPSGPAAGPGALDSSSTVGDSNCPQPADSKKGDIGQCEIPSVTPILQK